MNCLAVIWKPNFPCFSYLTWLRASLCEQPFSLRCLLKIISSSGLTLKVVGATITVGANSKLTKCLVLSLPLGLDSNFTLLETASLTACIEWHPLFFLCPPQLLMALNIPIVCMSVFPSFYCLLPPPEYDLLRDRSSFYSLLYLHCLD